MESLKGSKFSRRKFVQRSVMAGAASSLLPMASPAERSPVSVPTGPNLYEAIGVRPLVNAKGTYTIISGSLSLPEVKQAMEEAGRHYVNMDELMTAVGARLAKITGHRGRNRCLHCRDRSGKVAEDALPCQGWPQKPGDHTQALAQSV
jgi:hypothetical protein